MADFYDRVSQNNKKSLDLRERPYLYGYYDALHANPLDVNFQPEWGYQMGYDDGMRDMANMNADEVGIAKQAIADELYGR